MAAMLEENSGLLVSRGTPRHLTVVMHSRAYGTISKLGRARMPAPTFGALVGKVETGGEVPQVVVVEAVPMDLDASGSDLTTWDNLATRLGGSEGGFRLVG